MGDQSLAGLSAIRDTLAAVAGCDDFDAAASVLGVEFIEPASRSWR
jgi:hypothetical protein